MELGSVLLGLAGIALGVNTLKTGARRLAEGMQPAPRGASATGVRVVPGARVPTVLVPRAATRKMPPLVSKGASVKTRSGQLATSFYGVQNLNDRLAIIIDKAEQGKTDPKVIAWARKQVSQRKPGSTAWNGEQWQVSEKDGAGELAALFKGMRKDVRYVSDPYGTDTYAKPAKTLELGSGDCDEYAALGCAAAMAIGKRCEMVVIETKDSKEGANHIYPVAYSGGKRFPMDASVSMPFGWEAPDSMVARRWVYEVG